MEINELNQDQPRAKVDEHPSISRRRFIGTISFGLIIGTKSLERFLEKSINDNPNPDVPTTTQPPETVSQPQTTDLWKENSQNNHPQQGKR